MQSSQIIQIFPLPDVQSLYYQIHSTFFGFWFLYRLGKWIVGLGILFQSYIRITADHIRFFQRHKLRAYNKHHVLCPECVHFLDQFCLNVDNLRYGIFFTYV